MRLTAHCVLPAAARLGESALWLAEEQRLYWLDLKAPAIHRFDPATGTDERWELALEIPLGCLLRRADDLLLAGRRGLYAVDFDARALRLWFDPNDRPVDTAFNDGKTDRFGHIWLGSSHIEEREPIGKFYRIDRDGAVTVADQGFPCSNGPALSPDGTVLYFADTVGLQVLRYDLDPKTGRLSNRRLFLQFAPEQGQPDGMTVDEEGGLWVCHWGGWGVTRYTPEGQVSARIDLPAPNVTSCAFGDEDLRTLYITSAKDDMSSADAARAPLAGGLFAVRPGQRGLLEPIF
ncbi:MAG TPA: SMP-30/gluconolactonase/LRE family protein [Hypericibacter adhaerens]|jgi:sugar lactone lactonase YvrE|uniref:SMP-30/gluconolactonase/LRE family protein n=1 Tax=Hypericibacter adhaerens TaxID=2602016 RepID=UPI002BD8A4A0|nr:SMP-30/gluconolactonase/LRE family protein [Hypericibacter adhaerens]HWA42071.1 SMP-30/gluconolactonase/LRE family protein [Hypericibacter adhaerens]